MQNNNGLVYGLVAVVSVTMVAASAVYIFAPDRDLAPLLAFAGMAVTSLVTLAKVSDLGTKVEKVDKRTEDLTNGLMDAKIRAGVADVIRPEYVDPETHPQLEADRARRDEHPR